MNFTPFGTTFSGGLPSGGAVAQFTTAKFAHNVSSSGGQVVGLLSSDEAGVTYLRPVDTNGFVNLSQQGNGNSTEGSPQILYPDDGQNPCAESSVINQFSRTENCFLNPNTKIITLPISVPGSKPGELPQQQTLQIQVVNPGGASGGNTGEKYALPISLQPFQQGGTTVLTVAYSNPNQDPSSDQPIQLQLQSTEDAQVSQSNNNNTSSSTTTTTTAGTTTGAIHSNEMVLPDVKSISDDNNDAASQAYPVAVVTHLPSDLMLRSEDGGSKEAKKEEKKDSGTGTDGDGESGTGEAGSASWNAMSSSGAVADYLTRLSQSNSLPLSLHHYLKFSPETIKREAQIESSPLAPAEHSDQTQEESSEMDHSTSNAQQLSDDTPKGPKKKKKYKKKAPKPRKPRPGQVHIAFALDGTTLFCCPECNMAYPEKELLEQHLVAHKIERRFICDICGAGLKRKEHLERHKLGHNPERPYICSVCCKGFKRKEHLNLHFVIHSGEKSEVCPECGKGFHRKDHLRKHARSHLAKRVKEETIVVGEDGQPLSDQPLMISQHQQH